MLHLLQNKTIPLIQFSICEGREKYFEKNVFDYKNNTLNSGSLNPEGRWRYLEDIEYKQFDVSIQKEVSPLSVMRLKDRRNVSYHKHIILTNIFFNIER